MQLAPLCKEIEGMMVQDEVTEGKESEDGMGGAKRRETSRRKSSKQGDPCFV